MMEPYFQEGSQYGDFFIKRVEPIEEIQQIYYEITHTKTKATIIHLQACDKENLFSLSFRTYPDSHKGIPHILEHTVLCGSKKYPVSDPFFSMNRRSLNTFLNAMTGHDFTCYPGASQIKADFYNLLSVYCDAVFHPNLTYYSFLQEGVRLEVDHSQSSLSLKRGGIVYNEMKGSMNQAESRIWQKLYELLFPDLSYRFNYGGEPKAIASATHEDLIEFHQKYYHPGHCLFFFYGDIPLSDHLDFLAEQVLTQKVAEPEQIPHEKSQQRFKEPKVVHMPYPASSEENANTYISLGYLTCSIQDEIEKLALEVADSILMDTDASPLKHALQEELVVQADSYLDTELSEIPWVILCRGAKEKDTAAIQTLIDSTLSEICKEGFDKKAIEAALHQLELSRLEITSDGGPYGLSLFFRVALRYQHKSKPDDGLKVHTLFEKLHQKLQENPRYLESVVEKYLLENQHRATVIATPDFKLCDEEQKEENQGLQDLFKSLSKKSIEAIESESKKLKEKQKAATQEDISVLPILDLEAIDKDVRHFPLVYKNEKQLSVFHHDCFTNHMLYSDIIFDLPELNITQIKVAKLITSLLSQVGVGNYNYQQQLKRLEAYTGGVHASLSFHPLFNEHNRLRPSIEIRGKALTRHQPQLFQIMKDMILSPNFDNEDRVQELMLQMITNFEDRLTSHAMRYAIKHAKSSLSHYHTIDNHLNGVPFFRLMRHLGSNIAEHMPSLIESLNEVKNLVFHLNNPHLVVSCDQVMADKLKSDKYYGLHDLTSKPFTPWIGDLETDIKQSTGFTIPSQVAFNAMAMPAFGFTHSMCASLWVATHIIEHKILHPLIRERGGAYGSGVGYNPLHGSLHFYSYRDPNIGSTIDAFFYAMEEIVKGHFTNDDIKEAKLSLLQQLEHPIPPGLRALYSYSLERSGRSEAERQKTKNQVFDVDKTSVQDSITEILGKHSLKSTFCTFASKELINSNKTRITERFKNFEIDHL